MARQVVLPACLAACRTRGQARVVVQRLDESGIVDAVVTQFEFGGSDEVLYQLRPVDVTREPPLEAAEVAGAVQHRLVQQAELLYLRRPVLQEAEVQHAVAEVAHVDTAQLVESAAGLVRHIQAAILIDDELVVSGLASIDPDIVAVVDNPVRLAHDGPCADQVAIRRVPGTLVLGALRDRHQHVGAADGRGSSAAGQLAEPVGEAPAIGRAAKGVAIHRFDEAGVGQGAAAGGQPFGRCEDARGHGAGRDAVLRPVGQAAQVGGAAQGGVVQQRDGRQHRLVGAKKSQFRGRGVQFGQRQPFCLARCEQRRLMARRQGAVGFEVELPCALRAAPALEHVVAGAAGEAVVADAADQDVVARAAIEQVVAACAADDVVATAAQEHVVVGAQQDVLDGIVARHKVAPGTAAYRDGADDGGEVDVVQLQGAARRQAGGVDDQPDRGGVLATADRRGRTSVDQDGWRRVQARCCGQDDGLALQQRARRQAVEEAGAVAGHARLGAGTVFGLVPDTADQVEQGLLAGEQARRPFGPHAGAHWQADHQFGTWTGPGAQAERDIGQVAVRGGRIVAARAGNDGHCQRLAGKPGDRIDRQDVGLHRHPVDRVRGGRIGRRNDWRRRLHRVVWRGSIARARIAGQIGHVGQTDRNDVGCGADVGVRREGRAPGHASIECGERAQGAVGGRDRRRVEAVDDLVEGNRQLRRLAGAQVNVRERDSRRWRQRVDRVVAAGRAAGAAVAHGVFDARIV